MQIVDRYSLDEHNALYTVSLEPGFLVDVKVSLDTGLTYVMQNHDGSTVYGESDTETTYPDFSYNEESVIRLVNKAFINAQNKEVAMALWNLYRQDWCLTHGFDFDKIEACWMAGEKYSGQMHAGFDEFRVTIFTDKAYMDYLQSDEFAYRLHVTHSPIRPVFHWERVNARLDYGNAALTAKLDAQARDYEATKDQIADEIDSICKNIDEGKFTSTARISVIWDGYGIAVDLNYSFHERLGYGQSALCFSEPYSDGSPDMRVWDEAQDIGRFLQTKYKIPLDISRDEEFLKTHHNTAKEQNIDRRFEALKRKLFEMGPDAIQDFLDYVIDPNEDKDVIDRRMDIAYEQMPDDILESYFAKHNIPEKLPLEQVIQLNPGSADDSHSKNILLDERISSLEESRGYDAFSHDYARLKNMAGNSSLPGITASVWLDKLAALSDSDLRAYVDRYKSGLLDPTHTHDYFVGRHTSKHPKVEPER